MSIPKPDIAVSLRTGARIFEERTPHVAQRLREAADEIESLRAELAARPRFVSFEAILEGQEIAPHGAPAYYLRPRLYFSLLIETPSGMRIECSKLEAIEPVSVRDLER